jgi:hypothetical protein
MSQSPSLEVMPRAHVSRLRPAPLAAGADDRPDHRHGRTRQRASANPDGLAVLHERRRLLERHDFFVKAAVALGQPTAKA